MKFILPLFVVCTCVVEVDACQSLFLAWKIGGMKLKIFSNMKWNDLKWRNRKKKQESLLVVDDSTQRLINQIPSDKTV